MFPTASFMRMSRAYSLFSLLIITMLITSAVQAQAQPEMRRLTSKYYIIKTNVSDETVKPLIKHVDTIYEEYYARIKNARMKKLIDEKMTIYIMKNRDDYMALLAGYDIDGTGSGGMFFWDPKAKRETKGGLATYVEGQPMNLVLETLNHEGFHQFAFQWISPFMPIWIDEGLACYFESGFVYRNKFKVGHVGSYYTAQVKKAIKDGNYIPLKELLTMTGEQWGQNVVNNSEKASLQYAQAWSVVHFLVHGGAKYQRALNAYLKACNELYKDKYAFEMGFGKVDFKAFEKAWIKYVEKLKVDGISQSFTLLSFYADGMMWLRGSEIPFKNDLDDIKRLMIENDYWVIYNVDVGDKMRATDPGVFDLPRVRGNRIDLMIIPPKEADGYPGIQVKRVVPQIELKWYKDSKGNWNYIIAPTK